MFFIMGITQGRKDLDYNELVICEHCGSYGRLQVFVTYMCLSLFFIPCIKWGKKYYVQTTCCNTIYELDAETGRQIARGDAVEIEPAKLYKVQAGYKSRCRKCQHCGYETQEDFEYCPKCGQKF